MIKIHSSLDGYENKNIRFQLQLLRRWANLQPFAELFIDTNCIQPISNELRDKLINNEELCKILKWTNKYIWFKIDTELYTTNYVKRRIVNSKLEYCMKKGLLSKTEFIAISTNLRVNIDAVRCAILDKDLPF